MLLLLYFSLYFVFSVLLPSSNFVHLFQLCDLGFEDERIVDALLKHDNDRDKALEELIA